MFFVTLLHPRVATAAPSREKGEEAMRYLRNLRAKPPKGVDVHGVYFAFGRFDGVIPFEAPDLKTAMDTAVDIGHETGSVVETLPLLPIEDSWAERRATEVRLPRTCRRSVLSEETRWKDGD